MSEHRRLTFTNVVGQDTAKHALLLAAVEPLLGGVLLRGDKGSAKTTLARGLAALLPGDAPFVELPLGASEDRVVGSIDIAQLLTDGQPTFRPGLLAAAHGGVLYVDEINLLADHLVDALLDASATGINRVERDGVSHSHPARFVLVASMNPEEGELRPQLLDRFGLAVDVTTTTDPVERALAVRRQLTLERTGRADSEVALAEAQLRERVIAGTASTPRLTDEIIDVATRLAVAVGAEGLRADLMLCRAATAAAALDNDTAVTTEHLRSIAEMVLSHRSRRRPFDEPGIDREELDRAWQQATSDATADSSRPDHHDESAGTNDDRVQGPGGDRSATLPLAATRSPNTSTGGRFATGQSERGRTVRSRDFDPTLGIDAHATAIATAQRHAHQPGNGIHTGDLRSAERTQRQTSLVVFVLDTSASMGVERRMTATKAAVLGMLGDAYRRRGRVALIAFHHDRADIVLRPTASTEIASARLTDMPTGGTTPLAAGLLAAHQLIDAGRDPNLHTHVVVITDGRATHGDGDPTEAARAAGAQLSRTATSVAVIDTEAGGIRLGLARQLADSLGATYTHIDQLGDGGLETAAKRLTEHA